MHRDLNLSNASLDRILGRQEQRQVTKNLEIQYHNMTYQLTHVGKGRRLMHATVTVCESEDGYVEILHNTKPLTHVVFSKHNRPKGALTRKDVDAHLNKKKARPSPSADHPWRRNHSTKPMTTGGL